MDELGSVTTADSDDCVPMGKYAFSGFLRIVSKNECYGMSLLREELHTNGSRRILIVEMSVRSIEAF